MGRRRSLIDQLPPRWALPLGVLCVIAGLFNAYVDVLGWWRVAHPLGQGFRSVAPLAILSAVSTVMFIGYGAMLLRRWHTSRQRRPS